MRIIIDAMGGDHAPQAPVEAAVRAEKELDVDITLVGDRTVIERELTRCGYSGNRIKTEDAPDVISNHEEPVKAVRSKRGASVVVAANLLKDGGGDVMLSMGNTGALLTAGLLIVGRSKGVIRPALATVLPTARGPKLLIDAGANTNCKPENLVQFGIMGSVFMENVHSCAKPKVGLMSNGEEEGKGDDLTKKSFAKMQAAPFNFIGNIEGRDVMEGTADVIVCDGFVGNVILKTVEGMGHVVGNMLKDVFTRSLRTKIGAMFVMDGVRDLKKMMDYREYGGAPLLGTRKPVIKGHGSSDTLAVYSAIKQAKMFVDTNVINKIADNLKYTEDREDA